MTDILTMTPPADIREVWPTLRDRVAQIQLECDEPWLPEDVFNQLMGGQAFLWGTEGLEGFLVLQLAEQPYGRELHCWICCNGTGEPPIAYWPQLLGIAADHHCVRITFENDRRGFQRAIPGLRVRYRYSAEV
jgi:hypothetical protein